MKRPPILEGVKKILFYGDSLTDGSSYPDYVVNTLNRLFPDAGFVLMNSAMCGNTAADLLKRLKDDVLDRKPDLVSICIGTNDRWTNRDIAPYAADMEALATNLLSAGIKVMLIKPSPLGNPDQETKFQENLAVIQQVADRHKLLVADAHQVFLDGAKAGKEMLGADGVHHGKDGFEGMARAVLDALGFRGVEMDKVIKPWPGLLTSWESSDPVPLDGTYDLDEATGWKPYNGVALSKRQPWWNSPFSARGGFMPFDDVNPKQAAYGRTVYDAVEAGDCDLLIGGSPNPMVVWLNGKQVWRATKPHGYHPDGDRIAVRMEKGRNEIVGVSNFMLFVGVAKR